MIFENGFCGKAFGIGIGNLRTPVAGEGNAEERATMLLVKRHTCNLVSWQKNREANCYQTCSGEVHDAFVVKGYFLENTPFSKQGLTTPFSGWTGTVAWTTIVQRITFSLGP